MENGHRVHISGEVKWGDRYYNVSTDGVIEEWKKGPYALVTLDYIDGEFGVCVHVRKNQIEEREQEKLRNLIR